MSDMLDSGLQWMHGQRHAHMTQAVTYARGESTVDIQATMGAVTFVETDDDGGIIGQIESREFIIRAADLVLDSTVTLPRAGDTITHNDGSTSRVFRVTSPGGEPPFKYSDPLQRTLRIHTKYAGDAA